MTKVTISESLKNDLDNFLQENKPAELVNTYLFFLEKKYNIKPVLFPKNKVIYKSVDSAIKDLDEEGKIWHQTEIKISFGQQSVNEQTTKIYICPFTGKVFGNNTNPNPQDAIYNWVSKCPENTERVGGLRVKRFYVSDDSEVIKSYIGKEKTKEPVTKQVFSSVMSGKLFNSKEAVIKDFKKNYLKKMSLFEVQNQNRFQIEDKLVEFIQDQLVEEKIAAFVEAVAEIPEFEPIVQTWLG